MTNNALSEPLKALWAKTDPYHPLWCHLLDTAAVCEHLIICLGCPDDLPAVWTMYLAALHDIGKSDPEFQVLNDDQAAILRKLDLPLPSRKSEFRYIFEQCDDSSGDIGDVFSCRAHDLFVRYASDYSDKARLAEKLVELCRTDDYGVRNILFDAAYECLPKDIFQQLADRLPQARRRKMPFLSRSEVDD